VVYADALMKVVRLMTKMWPMLSRRNWKSHYELNQLLARKSDGL
jgi:hypothetical protein